MLHSTKKKKKKNRAEKHFEIEKKIALWQEKLLKGFLQICLVT